MVWWTKFDAIKSKADCKVFRESVFTSDDRLGGLRIKNEHGRVIEFTRKGDNWSVCEYSTPTPLGWITVEIANDENPSYDQTVDDIIWKYRKTLNAYFRRDD